MKRKRRGFGLVQLLVLLALLLILLGLLLPAVQKVREAAARMASSNNLKQIGLAVHNYADTFNRFPSGVDANHFSAHAHLLPYIEQANLHRTIDFKQSIEVAANAPARQALIKTYLSPRDELPFAGPASGPTNYFFCAGSAAPLQANNGLFFADSKVRFADITDGTSNTLLAGESLRGDGNTRGPGNVLRQHVRLPAAQLRGITADAGVKDFAAGRNLAANRGSAWIDGRFLQTTFNTARSINDPKPDVDCTGAGGLATLRSHSPVVLIALADGSVRTVQATLPPAVWKALATRAGGEVLPGF